MNQTRRAMVLLMSTPTNNPTPPTFMRRVIVAGRWALALAAALAIVLGFGGHDPLVRGAAFALQSVLLANALWQHTCLARACVGAAAITMVLGTVLSLFQIPPPNIPPASFLSAIGGVVGALVAYPALTFIDRFSPTSQE